MKVILQKDVAKLGRKFDIKDVSSGYAQNLLIPKGLAIIATPDAIKRMEMERAKAEGEKRVEKDLLAKNIKDLDGISINIIGKANDKGHLFAGIHKEAIVEELLKQTQLQIDPESISMTQPIKEIGEHTVEVKAGDKKASFKVVVSNK
jgi:large subunit ribosomal protein L9